MTHRFVSLCCAILLLATASATVHAESQQSDTHHIIVSGQASIASVPDAIAFSLSVEKQGTVAQKLYTQIAADNNAIIAFLLEQGIDEKDIQTSSVQFHPVYRYDGNRQHHEGFKLAQQMSVTLHDVSAFPMLVDGLIKRGMVRINQFSYVNKQAEADYLKALARAVENARERAEALAKSAKLTLGEVVNVEERSGYSPRPQMAEMAMRSDMPKLMPGTVETSANVSVTFSIMQ